MDGRTTDGLSWMPDYLWWSAASPVVFFSKAVFAKTFSPLGTVPSFYRDQLSLGGIHLCGDKTTKFLILLTETESCFKTSVCFIPVFAIADTTSECE